MKFLEGGHSNTFVVILVACIGLFGMLVSAGVISLTPTEQSTSATPNSNEGEVIAFPQSPQEASLVFGGSASRWVKQNNNQWYFELGTVARIHLPTDQYCMHYENGHTIGNTFINVPEATIFFETRSFTMDRCAPR